MSPPGEKVEQEQKGLWRTPQLQGCVIRSDDAEDQGQKEDYRSHEEWLKREVVYLFYQNLLWGNVG